MCIPNVRHAINAFGMRELIVFIIVDQKK
jgi:hypothetical protein